MRLQLHRKEGFLLASEWRRRRRRRWLSRRLTPLPPTIKQQQWLIKSREEEKRVPGAFSLPPSLLRFLSWEQRGKRAESKSGKFFVLAFLPPPFTLSQLWKKKKTRKEQPERGRKIGLPSCHRLSPCTVSTMGASGSLLLLSRQR